MPFHVLAVSFNVWMISKQNVYLVNSKQIFYIYIEIQNMMIYLILILKTLKKDAECEKSFLG